MGEPDPASRLMPRDLLVICTDGVTEAPNSQGDEYGEARLSQVIQANRGLPVNKLPGGIQASVQEFSGPTQADDITLIVARCTEIAEGGAIVRKEV